MTEQEIYNKYLELIIDKRGFTKKEIAEQLGFGGVKRPDMKLASFLKKYNHKKEDTTNHNTNLSTVNKGIQVNEISLVTQKFFNEEDNVKILMELVEAHKKREEVDEIEIIDLQLPQKYRTQKNEQKSIRVNHKLFKDWDKTMKKNPNFTGLTQSQILNYIFFETMEKYK